MDSGEDSSSDSPSSTSTTKPLPVGGAEDEEMVYLPPHFPQRQKSGSDFSPPSESSEDDQSLSSASDKDQQAPPIQTYAPPPTHPPQDFESGSDMESGHSHHGSIPYDAVPGRRRQVNYKQFYSGDSESGSESGSDSEVGWQKKKRKLVSGRGHPLQHVPLNWLYPYHQNSDSEFELSDVEQVEEEDSFLESMEESSEGDEPVRGGRRGQGRGGWIVSGSDSDYRPGGEGGRGRRKRQQKNHWNRRRTKE